MSPVQHPTADAVGAAIGLGSGPQRRWPWLLAAALLALAAGAAWYAYTGRRTPAPRYQTATAQIGNLVVKVSATGNLQPTNQVDVGSELSGTVERVYVDDNDRVSRGQVLAQLDLSRLQDQVARSEAALAQAEAQVAQTRASTREAQLTLQRLRGLQQRSQGGVPAAADLSAAEAALARAEANEAAANAGVGQARAALRSDRTNVDKASIRSPVDGVVLLRRVEPGQTVAATLQAPVLFTLAESLSQMQLQVNVDEADVGQVQVGQEASFSVDAYPDRRYPATISRVGYGAQTSNGVVTYLTVLEVDNRDLSLRPGMTATAEITTLQREQVLLVPNAALRWSPPDTAGQAVSRGIVGSLVPRLPQTARRGGTTAPRAGATRTLWLPGGNGQPQALEVTVGASDGRMTEIGAGGLRAGQAVIVDSADAPP